MHRRSNGPRRLLLALSVVVACFAGVLGVADPAAAAPPANDSFANRETLLYVQSSDLSTTVDATVEPGEPSAAGPVVSSVWYRWTATYTGPAFIQIFGGYDPVTLSFDPQVAVYTGSTVGALVAVAADDDSGPGTSSRVDFDVVAGVQYQIQVDGAGSTVGTFTLQQNTQRFHDVSRTHPFWRDISWIASEGIAYGFTDGGYHPSANISRGAMAAFLYRLAHIHYSASDTPAFDDVSTTHPFYREIEWMNAVGITTGVSPRIYQPDAPVTRQAMAAFLYRFEAGPPFTPPATPTFVDVGLGHAFFTEIEWMASTGITTGYPGGLFKPAAFVSRASMAAFLHRYRPNPS
jgi:hypothetical protein